MATGRTINKYARVYLSGYDLSGYARNAPELMYGFDENAFIALTDAVTGALPGRANISAGTLSAVLDNTSGGIHDALASNSDSKVDVMVPLGIRAAPAIGDPCWCAQVSQNSYQAEPSGGMVTVSVDLGNWDERGDSKAYPIPWGYLIHAKGARTATNTSSGASGIYDHGSQTTNGGFMMYQLFSSDDEVTALKIQDSTGGAWSDLVSSGALDASSTPQAGIAALGSTGTVDRYLRWQIDLSGAATTATFALAFVRGR